jgi:hypothetical protein
MVYLPDEEALDEFVAREDRLQQEESDRYGNAMDDRFTTLYYPQSRYDYNLSQSVLAAMDFAVLEDPCCTRCKSHVRYSTFRRVRGDSEFCVDCLRTMGCCILRGSEHVLFPDLVAVIMSFLPEYYHATRAARVSRMWLSCFNFDHTHESDLMALKRDWISREIWFRSRAVLSAEGNARLQAFIARFDLGALLGEWVDNTVKTRYRWLRLCSAIAESAFYVSKYGIMCSRMSGNPTYSEEANMCVMSVPLIGVDRARCNVYRIPRSLMSGGTIDAVLSDADATFSATVHTTNGKTLDIEFDARNGTIVGPDDTPMMSKKKRWHRCIFC